MTNGPEPRYEDDDVGRYLARRLPRHPAPPALRAAILRAATPETPPRRFGWWLAPAASALATAMLGLLLLLPALPSAAPPDPLRPLARAAISEHARAVLWGESRPDVVPAVLPRVMEQSGVTLNWLFTGDDTLTLVNAQPTYLEGRRAITLAYEDADGHNVTYLILPAGQMALPERGRVQVDRFRPLLRQENGWSLLVWRQQGLLCVLVSDLVSDQDLGRFKEYFVKLRTSTDPYPVY
jgi:anti-sigma factor RsiW